MTGEISGWDEFYELLSLDGPTNQDDIRAKQERDIQKWQNSTKTTYVILAKDQQTTQMQNRQSSLARVVSE